MRAALSFVAFCLRIIAIAVTNWAFAWTLLGCAPNAVHVATADPRTFQEMLDADVAADARREAMWMEPRARRRLSRQATVLDNDKLPEAYTLNGEQARWASQFHLSYAALRLIRAHYAATHPSYRQLDSDDLVDVVDEAGGNTHSVNPFERDRQLDIFDVEGRFVFQVVPPGPTHEAAGKKKVEWELLLLNKTMLGVPEFKLGTGYEGEIGVRFAENAPPWKVVWATTAPGIIRFEWLVLSVDEATEQAHREAYLDNRWHAPTAFETTLFGRTLHQVVEKLVQAREELGQTRAVTEMPLLPGQTITDYQRSVALWSDYDDKTARLLPLVRPDLRGASSVPEPVAKRLASCVRPSAARLKPAPYSMSFNVHVTNKGKAVSAYIKESTLGERNIEACMVAVLRQTSWLGKVEPVATVHPAPVSRAFFAQPAPALTPPDSGPVSGTYPKGTYPQQAPQGDPRGLFKPLTFTVTFGPLIAGVVVFGAITFWSSDTAPAWMSELNPITGRQYKSEPEYEAVRRLTPAEIQAAQRAHIKATQSQPPPAPAPPPAPSTPAQPAQQKQLDPKCDKFTEKIDEIINKEREATPKGGYPQGRKGIKWRWRELAANVGKWGYKADGRPGDKLQGHLNEYDRNQKDLIKELVSWYKGLCHQKGYTLPNNALQYAAQKPEIGPGKPLEPAPSPVWSPPPVTPAVIAPQPKK